MFGQQRRFLVSLVSVRRGAGEFGIRMRSGTARPAVAKGCVTAMRTVPPYIARPPYAATGQPPARAPEAQVHGLAGRDAMRRACAVAAEMLEYAGTLVRPGVTTDEIDAAFHARVVAAGYYPSPLNYAGFPKSICASVNEVVCHGIPDECVCCCCAGVCGGRWAVHGNSDTAARSLTGTY